MALEESKDAQWRKLPHYCFRAPSAQNAVDIFEGEWTSRFPDELDSVRAGKIPLFNDPRVTWGLEALGGAAEKTVLELGPLEGAHTYMLERAGARQIVAIEANTRAFLRCLIVKELLGLQRAQFSCGDFVEYLRKGDLRFDLCLAIGVLYHMSNPVELLSLIAQTSDHVVLWTHYYDHAIISARPDLAAAFVKTRTAEHAGFKHALHDLVYGTHDVATFLGGQGSSWLERADILRALEHFGFTRIEIAFEQPEHVAGPCFALAASKLPLR